MATALAGLSGRTAMSAIGCAWSPPWMQFQLHPSSGATLSPTDTPAMSALLVVKPTDGSSTAVGPRPSASSHTKAHVAPLSCDGRMPYDVRRTMRLSLFGENTIWFDAGKRPFAEAGTLERSAPATAAAKGRALRTRRIVAPREWSGTWASRVQTLQLVACASLAARGDGHEGAGRADFRR